MGKASSEELDLPSRQFPTISGAEVREMMEKYAREGTDGEGEKEYMSTRR